mgnify:CR=1 FL=1
MNLKLPLLLVLSTSFACRNASVKLDENDGDVTEDTGLVDTDIEDTGVEDTGTIEDTGVVIDTGDTDPVDTGDTDPVDTGDTDPVDTGDTDPVDTGLRTGLQLVATDNQHPFESSFWRHRFGFGAANRLNGVVIELANGGSYTVPSGY